MKLSDLLHDLFPGNLIPALEILDLTRHSQEVQPGALFIASRGKSSDGKRYIEEAIAKGAVAILAEADRTESSLEWRQNIPLLRVPELSQHLTALASRFYGKPQDSLKLLGVTGTNGKTSWSHFMAQCLEALEQPCALIGTLGAGRRGQLKSTQMTTPDGLRLQKILAECLAEKAKYVAMEVSSHALDQGRVQGLSFEVGVFTNLTQDHLDYHGSMEAYGSVKKRFFTDYPMRFAVINADDAFGRQLLSDLPPEKTIAYSIHKPTPQKGLWVYAHKAQFDLSGIRAQVVTPWGEGELKAPLIGSFNLSNVLAVLASLGALGHPLDKILKVISQIQAVPGRMQIFGGEKQPWVVVDYAHTPDALEKTLLALRQHCQGRLACLFGCGGDRDKGKRPLMGAVAEKNADWVMLTDDNPRHEVPAAIIQEILAGFKQPEKVKVQGNRSKAIQDIIQCSKAGDYILIAGKGAETYQEIGDLKHPFSDAEHIREILGNNACYYG